MSPMDKEETQLKEVIEDQTSEKETKKTPPTEEEIKRMRLLRKIKKVENYALYLGLAMILLGIFVPYVSYIGTASFILTYITALVKQKLQNGKITFISFILGTAAICWLLLSQFVESPYVRVFGQLVLYSYLMNTQYNLLGKVQKSFIFIAVSAIALGFAGAVYPSKIVSMLNFAMQIFIILRFLDPILEKIGIAHREKRLALEAEQKEKEKQKEESSFQLEKRNKKTVSV